MQNVSNDAAGTAADDAEGGAPLQSVKLSLTGFEDQVEREEIAETVQRLGGQFCSQLERHTCTHLLVADGLPKETEKVVAARKWGGIALVPLAWLHACVQAGARVPEAGFLLSPLVPAAAPGQGGSQKEASARRSARAENTVLTGGVSAWEEDVARLSWQEAPMWDALHLSGFRIAFSGAPGDAATSAVHRNLREAAWRGGATVVTDVREATHVVVTGGSRRAGGQSRLPASAAGETAAVEVTVDWLLAACRGDVAGVTQARASAGDVCRVNG